MSFFIDLILGCDILCDTCAFKADETESEQRWWRRTFEHKVIKMGLCSPHWPKSFVQKCVIFSFFVYILNIPLSSSLIICPMFVLAVFSGKISTILLNFQEVKKLIGSSSFFMRYDVWQWIPWETTFLPRSLSCSSLLSDAAVKMTKNPMTNGCAKY